MNALRILGVHGVKNYQPGLQQQTAADRLAEWWKHALVEHNNLTADRLSLDIAYYAHELAMGIPQGYDDPNQLDSKIQNEILEWAKLMGLPDETAQGMLTLPARAAIDWVARKSGLDCRLLRLFVAAFFREVHIYFTHEERRQASLADVMRAVERIEPRVIIAHSLGSVVVYEGLWTRPHPDIELLLTLGSPLAMPDIVFPRLVAHPGHRGRPPGVARWINISDPGDLIAIPHGSLPRNFERVTADLTDSIHVFDFHRVTNYLSCGATAGVLSAYF